MIIGEKRKHFKVIPDDMILKEAEIPLSDKCKKVWAVIKIKVLDVKDTKTTDGEWIFVNERFLSKRKISNMLGMSVDTVSNCLDELEQNNMISYRNEPKTQILKDSDGNSYTYRTQENFITVNTETETWGRKPKNGENQAAGADNKVLKIPSPL